MTRKLHLRKESLHVLTLSIAEAQAAQGGTSNVANGCISGACGSYAGAKGSRLMVCTNPTTHSEI